MENPSENIEPEVPVVVPGKKRKFPLAIRKSIVEHYDSLPNDGSKGAYLRRNGLFDSAISMWRNELINGTAVAKAPAWPQVAGSE